MFTEILNYAESVHQLLTGFFNSPLFADILHNAMEISKILGITGLIILAFVVIHYVSEFFGNPEGAAAANEAAIDELTERKLLEKGIVPSWRTNV